MFSFFKKNVSFGDFSNNFFQEILRGRDLVGFAYEIDQLNKIRIFSEKNKQQKIINGIDKNGSTSFYIQENKKTQAIEVNSARDLRLLIENLNLYLLEDIKTTLLKSESFSNDKTMNEFEWLKVSFRNFETAIDKVCNSDENLMNFHYYYKPNNKELIFQVFNYDIKMIFNSAPSVHVIIFENKNDENNGLVLNDSPMFNHQFNDQSLKVYDLIVSLLSKVASKVKV